MQRCNSKILDRLDGTNKACYGYRQLHAAPRLRLSVFVLFRHDGDGGFVCAT